MHIDRRQGLVVKRFTSWDRGEPEREWAALTLLATAAPGLAPDPVSRSTDGPPAITMSLLPGTPLDDGPLSSGQTGALAGALRHLWSAKPPPQRGANLLPNVAGFTAQVHGMLAAGPPPGLHLVVRRAYETSAAWLHASAATLSGDKRHDADLVLGQGDPCLANFLWDGTRVRIVDFEDSGPSERAFELGIMVEHLSVWLDAGLAADPFLHYFDLSLAEKARVLQYRRLAALFWLIRLLPGGPSSTRNAAGTVRRQAERVLALHG